MKKGIIFSLLLIFMCFTLVGCTKEKTDEDDILNQFNDNQQDNKEDEEDYKIDLYSDNTKMVFDFSGVYKIVYYYNGDKITGLEYYFDYQDKSTAKYAVTAIKSQYEAEDNIKSVEQKGQYVIVKFTEEEYKDTTVEEIKQTYSYLEQVYDN